jgi:hypothetical protein
MDKERPSPSKSATLYNVGTIKTGNDGNKYIIVENKNGVKKWQKHKKVTKKNNTKLLDIYKIKILDEVELNKIALKNKTYQILTQKVIPEINDLKIKTFIVPLPLSKTNLYWSDYFPPTYIQKIYNKNINNISYMYLIIYMNKEGDKIIYDKPIKINFSNLTKKTKISIINIFEKHLLGQYNWNEINNNWMIVSFHKNKDIKNNMNTMLYVNIQFDINHDSIDNMYNNMTKLVIYFEKTCVKYIVLWHIIDYNLKITINLLDNNKIIEKLKKHITKQKNINHAKFIFVNLKDNKLESNNIWSYKK